MKKRINYFAYVDPILLLLVIALASIGLVMMGSASIDFSAKKYGSAFFHIYKQGIFLGLAVIGATIVYLIPTKYWYKISGYCLLLGFALLIAVLIPGIGREVNGSMRWIPIGPGNLQSSEVAKFCMLMYLAGYLVRRDAEVKHRWRGFLKPVLVLCLMIVLLLLEPDFGSAVVMIFACMGMIFLAGVGLTQFSVLVGSALGAMTIMAISSQYRMARLKCFLDPWEQPYDCGYQLTQSLIAFGRGEWFGLGLGNSIQKLFYLPEAHTDFVFAIIAEELGFFGAIIALCLFAALIAHLFKIAWQAQQAKQLFGAYFVYGVALVLSAQVFINIGVNTGMLPTKGLTLPFFSYGGSSVIVMFAMMAAAARVSAETKLSSSMVQAKPPKKQRVQSVAGGSYA